MKSYLLVVVLGMLVCFLPANAMQTQPSQQKLEVQGALILGETQKKTLVPKTIHVWDITVEKGQYSLVEVEQKGIDLVVRVIDPNGSSLGKYDMYPTERWVAEKVAWIAGIAGRWKIEISALDSSKSGNYEIKMVILRKATEKDRQTIEADSLNSQAELYMYKVKFELAEPLFRNVLAIRENALGTDHPDVALCLSRLGMLYYQMGNYASAEQMHKRAMEIREKALGTDHMDVATSLNNLARVYQELGEYTEAESLYRQSLAIFEKAQGAEHPNVANNLYSIAIIYKTIGKYSEAEQLYRRCIEILEKSMGRNHPYTGLMLNGLAGLYWIQSKYTEAELLYRQSLAILEKALGSENRNVAELLNNLGLLYSSQHRYAEAVSLFQQSLIIWEKVLGPNHSNVAYVLGNLGMLYSDERRYAEAIPNLQRSLAIREKALGSKHPLVGKCLNYLARLYRDQGKYAEAESFYRRVLKILENALEANHPDVATTQYDLALLFKTQGNYNEALTLLEQAILILNATTGYPNARVDAYALRSQLRKQMGDWQEALSDLAEALHSAETMRPQIGGGEETQAGFFEKYIEYFNLMITWLLEAEQIEKALEYAERGRARVFLDQLAVAQIDLLNSISGADKRIPLEKRQTDAKAHMAEYQQRINRLPPRKDLSNEVKDQQITALKDSLKLAGKEYEQVWEEIKLASPLWQNVVTSGGQPVSLATIQNELVPKNGLMLLYQIGKEGSHLFVIPPGEQKTEVISLQIGDKEASILQVKAGPLKSTDLQKILVEGDSANFSIGLLRYLKTNPDVAKAEQEKPATAKLQALGNVLMPSSIWPKVKACAEVIIIPDGLLHQLPFEALVVQSGKTPADTTRYWLDEGPVIRYAPSATILYSLEKRPIEKPPAQPSILSLSDPIFDLETVGKEIQKQIASRGATPQDSTTTKSSGLMETLLAETRGKEREFAGPLPRLFGTDTETNYIRQYFGAKNVKALQQLQADEPNLRANIQGKRYVHLATHGLVELQQSSLSNALALTPPPKDTVNSENDGFLKLYEIYELKLNNCELAVLSACETHFGRLFEGEGVFALSRGFLAAGAARVVASHWQVNDISTAQLVGAFFRSVANAEKNGKPVDYALALRDAKLKLRRDKNRRQWAAPYFWAPFIITGKR